MVEKGEIMILKDKGLQEKDFALLVKEDMDQIAKWGLQEHHPFEWLAYLVEEVGELSEAISEYLYRNGKPEAIVKEALQTATLALKVAVMVKRQLDLGITEETVISLLNKHAELLEKETHGLVKGDIDNKEHYYVFYIHTSLYDYRLLSVSHALKGFPLLIKTDDDLILQIKELYNHIEQDDSGSLLIHSQDELEEVLEAIFATERVKGLVENIMTQAKEKQDESR